MGHLLQWSYGRSRLCLLRILDVSRSNKALIYSDTFTYLLCSLNGLKYVNVRNGYSAVYVLFILVRVVDARQFNFTSDKVKSFWCIFKEKNNLHH
jgi:hypothetical protein